jgi:hypothetical protein
VARAYAGSGRGVTSFSGRSRYGQARGVQFTGPARRFG